MPNRPELEEFAAGYEAAEKGGKAADCPHPGGAGDWKYGDWLAGFQEWHRDQVEAKYREQVAAQEELERKQREELAPIQEKLSETQMEIRALEDARILKMRRVEKG